jgi:hypothetical protein
MVVNQFYMIHDQLPFTPYTLPVTHYPLPFTRCRLPITCVTWYLLAGTRFNATRYQLPVRAVTNYPVIPKLLYL